MVDSGFLLLPPLLVRRHSLMQVGLEILRRSTSLNELEDLAGRDLRLGQGHAQPCSTFSQKGPQRSAVAATAVCSCCHSGLQLLPQRSITIIVICSIADVQQVS